MFTGDIFRSVPMQLRHIVMGVIYTRSNNDDRMFGDGICLSKSSSKLLCMWLACTYLALQLILDIDLAKPKEQEHVEV